MSKSYEATYGKAEKEAGEFTFLSEKIPNGQTSRHY
jgi:hypothetical protein